MAKEAPEKEPEKEPQKEPEKKAEPFAAQAPTVQPEGPVPSPGGSGTVFERVKATEPVSGADRDPPHVLINPSGLTRTNTGAFVLVEDLRTRLGLDTTYALDGGANVEKKQIALYPVHGTTPGAAPVRRYEERQSLTIYLKHLFKKYHTLAPRVRQECKVYLDRDSNGEECVVLALGTALDKPITSRGKRDGTNA